jgi:hypothetical protein
MQQAAGAIEVGDDDEGAKGFYESEGADVTTSKEVTSRGGLTGKKDKKQMSDKAWKEYLANETDEKKAKRTAREISEGLREPDKVTTVNTTVKGENEMDDVQLKRSQKSDVMEPWQISRMQRSIKKEQKQIRKSKLKQRPENVSRGDWRKQVKAEENAAEQKEFEALARRNIKARESGKRGGSRDVAGFDRNKSVGEDSDKVQVVKAQKAAELAAKKKKESATPMRSNSPAKKALVGKQNQLPPQLQASIKAAPGKMKSSPYKMKGSMFKKRY